VGLAYIGLAGSVAAVASAPLPPEERYFSRGGRFSERALS